MQWRCVERVLYVPLEERWIPLGWEGEGEDQRGQSLWTWRCEQAVVRGRGGRASRAERRRGARRGSWNGRGIPLPRALTALRRGVGVSFSASAVGSHDSSPLSGSMRVGDF